MNFSIAPSDPTPIYRQIVDQVRRQMAGGQLRPGMELPSVRALAQQHAINPMTVSKAYSLLESEGLLERRRGMGMVVAGQGARSAVDPERLLAPLLQALVRQAAELGLPPEALHRLIDQTVDNTADRERP
ncbi:GntR family transcriptional regulator [Limnohabitans sp.]|uniref:GntR family transcriptional regulator n=1 Tax=Limnohabitans sp. TaxID=1907725 RepID=UPI0037BE62C4